MMSEYILNIDTAVEGAAVSISSGAQVIVQKNHDQKLDHASFLQPAIAQLLAEVKINFHQLSAVAVSNGPGSYTGLRIGMATAKGICYGLNLPLICVPTLEIMAAAAITATKNNVNLKDAIICPMIDARRMEVFTATYNQQLQLLSTPEALVLNESSFNTTTSPIIFTGNGVAKWQSICANQQSHWITEVDLIAAMARLSHQQFKLQTFAVIAYAEPFYLKPFYSSKN